MPTTVERPEIVERQDAGPRRRHGEVIEQPAKIMRIGTMIRTLLEEARSAELDEKSRDRLRDDLRHVGPGAGRRRCRPTSRPSWTA